MLQIENVHITHIKKLSSGNGSWCMMKTNSKDEKILQSPFKKFH